MLIESLVLSIIVGKIRGGKIKSIGNLKIKGWYLFVIGFLLEYSSIYIEKLTYGRLSVLIREYFYYIHIIVYILLIIGLILNLKNKGILFVFIGSLFNFTAIILNGGKMPVSLEGLKYSSLLKQMDMLKNGKILTHKISTEAIRVYFLTDIIPIPNPYPLPKVISVGDIFVALGVFFIIQKEMLSRKRKDNILDFTYGTCKL
ncbi:DUF5317 domain-containing protein [Anaerosalibacter bizertensis]|uniref:DUF5317 domain-containing protein n=1 Tax=Anaerosalibacter bizertensis TaxID=932217 RepID=UPI001C0F09A8|nr:DUF5317 domain-containing protein [Anaerosalibacter bizertensis]MBU5293892.1 DUF5317 domain-containing protein [Anaerosalibacter bizertensis]